VTFLNGSAKSSFVVSSHGADLTTAKDDEDEPE
jgi:hypothetical protein